MLGSARTRACALVLVLASSASAETFTIDRSTAIARARERAPAAIVARARTREATTARAGAEVVFTDNPTLEVAGGPRFGPLQTQLAIKLGQTFETTRPAARVRVAEAHVAHAMADVAAELRELDYAVALAWNATRYHDLVVELALHQEDVARRAFEASERRRKAGDVTDLEVDLARIALGRARSLVAAERADRAEAGGRLAVLIGARPDDTIAVTGALRAAPPPRTVAARPDLRALDAEVDVARAGVALATAQGRPDIGVWLGYERDQGQDVVMAGLAIALPVWNRAQADKAVARGQEQRVLAERAAIASAASREIVDATATYDRAREALEIFEREVVPALADAEQLLDKSIAAGQLAVNAYLVARGEILAGRREQLDRELALANAAAYAGFVAGVAP